jgi:hypothetical protein
MTAGGISLTGRRCACPASEAEKAEGLHRSRCLGLAVTPPPAAWSLIHHPRRRDLPARDPHATSLLICLRQVFLQVRTGVVHARNAAG